MSNTENVTKTDLPSYQISNEISNEIEATVPAPFEEETEQFIPTVTILIIRITIFITIFPYITILASSIFLTMTSPGSHVCHNNANTLHKKNYHHSRTCRRLRRLLRL